MIDLVKKAFEEYFPIRAESELLELSYVDIERRDDGNLGVIVRLIYWESGPEHLSITDVYEQSVYLKLALDLPSIVRLRELLAAMTKVLPRVLTHVPPNTMPHEVLDFGALAKKLTTEAEFVAALERSRLLAPYLTNPA